MSETGRSGDDGADARVGGPALEVFERERGRLFGVAYRMLGSVRDAVANGRIDSFYVVVNPDKLAAVERGLDARRSETR